MAILKRTMPTKRVRITSIEFANYKALKDFDLRLQPINILVGANNHGKSTVIGSLRILDLAIRTMRSRQPTLVQGPTGQRAGWRIAEDSLPVSTENVHTDYAEVDTTIRYRCSNGSSVTVLFPSDGGCFAFADSKEGNLRSPAEVRSRLPIALTIVPILGPLDYREEPVKEETVRRNLSTTRASRNFRNYWRYNREQFADFASLVARTWPGMEVSPPEVIDGAVVMFCDEKRRARELFWAGFGFQIWLQLLTHICRADNATMIVVDEPELYLHPDIQRQLLGILRESGADLMMATHSTEIIADADPTEICLVDKSKQNAERLRDVEGIQRALDHIGSIQNITLARLARNRRVLFVEGNADTRLLARFARKLGRSEVASWAEITPIESGGFSSWRRVKALAEAFEEVLGFKLHVGVVFDRDYWCDEEIAEIERDLRKHIEVVHMHRRKEIESYLLEPVILDRAIDSALEERAERTGSAATRKWPSAELLRQITDGLKVNVQAQFVTKRVAFLGGRRVDDATITREGMQLFEDSWQDLSRRLTMVPAKDTLAAFRTRVSEELAVSLTDHRIVGQFEAKEISTDICELIDLLDSFRKR